MDSQAPLAKKYFRQAIGHFDTPAYSKPVYIHDYYLTHADEVTAISTVLHLIE